MGFPLKLREEVGGVIPTFMTPGWNPPASGWTPEFAQIPVGMVGQGAAARPGH